MTFLCRRLYKFSAHYYYLSFDERLINNNLLIHDDGDRTYDREVELCKIFEKSISYRIFFGVDCIDCRYSPSTKTSIQCQRGLSPRHQKFQSVVPTEMKNSVNNCKFVSI